jgi:hypothetical protein
MSRWFVHAVVSLSQALLLTAALWSWAAFSSVLIARAISGRGYLTATSRSLWIASLSSLIFIPAATTDLFYLPRANLLGVPRLIISPPYTWWVWGAILLCEPLVTGIKIVHYRSLLRADAEFNGAPHELHPRWVKLFEGLLADFLDVSNYVGR